MTRPVVDNRQQVPRRCRRVWAMETRITPVDVGGGSGSAILFDVSEDGVALIPLVVLKKNSCQNLKWRLPWGVQIEAQAVVAWTGEDRAGLRFTRLSDEARRALQHWVQEQAVDAGAAKFGPESGTALPATPNLQEAVRRAFLLTNSDGAAIALEFRNGIVCVASSGDAPPVGTMVDPSSGLSGECLHLGRAVICHDAASDKRVSPEICMALNMRSAAAVPLSDEHRVVGFLYCQSRDPGRFGQPEVLGLQKIAKEIIGALPGSVACTSLEKSKHNARVLAIVVPLIVLAILWLLTSSNRASRATQHAPVIRMENPTTHPMPSPGPAPGKLQRRDR